jgi:hypothetical protein
MFERASADRAGAIVAKPELGPETVGPLQVVADELVELGGALAERAFQVLRESLVELGALGLRDRVVGGIPKEDVAEPERPIASHVGWVRADEILEEQGAQEVVDT